MDMQSDAVVTLRVMLPIATHLNTQNYAVVTLRVMLPSATHLNTHSYADVTLRALLPSAAYLLYSELCFLVVHICHTQSYTS